MFDAGNRSIAALLALVFTAACRGGASTGGGSGTTPDPTAPGGTTPIPSIADMTVAVANNRDSAILTLPAVAGAADFRAYPVSATTTTTAADGTVAVDGGTTFCAGLVQHNAKLLSPLPVANIIQVDGIKAPTDFVVEAIDRLCPFPGLIAKDHHDIDVTWQEVEPAAQGVFSYVTEDEVRAKYGSLVVNGQGPGVRAGVAAAPNPPRVLARTVVHVVPAPNAPKPTATFFDDFSDETDQPVFVKSVPGVGNGFQAADNGQLWQSSKWSIYSYGSEHTTNAAGVITENTFRPFITRGALHMVLADWSTDVFSSAIAYPRQVVHPSSTSYVHVTYEVESNATDRRYWNLFLCGPDTAGQTFNAAGEMLGNIIQTPFFFNADGVDPSANGWNCLQVYVFDGSPFTLPPTDTAPESDLHVMVNLPDKPARTSVVNVSPDQYLATYPGQTNLAAPSWFRQQSNGKLGRPVMDDKLTVGSRVHYDLWIRRDRVVLFVDGEQRLCNDFPSVALTMPEAALGFGQVLYHSSAERILINASYWVRDGQQFILKDAPFADSRSWDNLGFEEGVAAIPNFDATACYVHGP